MKPLLCGAWALLLSAATPLFAQSWDCRVVRLESGSTVARGPEDFELDPTPGASRLIVGSRPPFVVPVTASGLGTPQPIAIAGNGKDVKDLHLIGLSAVIDRDGTPLLYAIDKGRGVAVFEIQPGQLVYRTTLAGDLGNANAVLALPNGHVYVSRGQGTTKLRWLIEALFGRPWAKLMFFDGTTWREEVRDLRFGNGLQISQDGKTLYVASFRGREIRAYERNDDGTLGETPRHISLPAMPDNLKWSDDGKLTVAAHPSLFRSFLYTVNIGSPPSEVYEIDVHRGSVERIYRNDGSPIGGASSAQRKGDRMFITQIVRPWLADCVRKEKK